MLSMAIQYVIQLTGQTTINIHYFVMQFFSVARQHPVGQGLLIAEASRTHSDTSHSVGLLWTIDQPDADPSTRQHTTLTRDRHPYHLRNSNPVIPARERPQTQALDRAL